MRTDPPTTGPELEMLSGFLDFQRETVLEKAAGLSRDDLARQLPPSALTLGGLLNHLALVEDSWFRVRFLGEEPVAPWGTVDWKADPDWEFHTAADLEPDQLRERYREACARSRAAVAEAEGLDQLSVKSWPDGTKWTLRWILVHMIEETARHAGHADLLRESIDGVVGE